MIYLIDANNLAGMMKILREPNFDQQLIDALNAWTVGKKHKIHLVFDGVEVMGERYRAGAIDVIRAPRDSYYKTADDKIIELASELAQTAHEEIVVVTDDLDLTAQVGQNKRDDARMRQVRFEKAAAFARRLADFLDTADEDDEKELDDQTTKSINDELLQLWK